MSEPRFDANALRLLHRAGGEKLISKMSALFAANAPQRIKGAEEALATGDLAGAITFAHSLKSSAGQLGAVRLQQLCDSLESACVAGNLAHARELVRAAREELPASIDWTATGFRVMKKIAVIEDNPDNRLLVRALLEDQYEILEYEDGVSALAQLGTNLPNLVLLDISLPHMDGSEVLKRIRADENLKALPVIALTAHAGSADREKFLTEGFDDYVTKPITDEAILLLAIERLI